MGRLRAGDVSPARTLHSADGVGLRVPAPDRYVHLYFSRFADCPICTTQIADLRRRAPDLDDAGIQTIAIFHSPAEQVRRYRTDLPFPLVADPDRSLYRAWGVTPSRRALLHPQALGRLLAEARAGNRAQEAHGGIHGLPAAFLIAPDGGVLIAHYGSHADDNLAVQTLLDAVHPSNSPRSIDSARAR